ncbi:MAG TPA: alcohol dehydrogenase [Lachnospiraceae bacterium]|nr:alcohol dehydrogenase [Lachnospiraceae bacterium]
MKKWKTLYCRTFQLVMRMALPFLPYREPKMLRTMDEVAKICERRRIRRVLLVTDSGIRGAGLTEELEEKLAERQIDCFVYDGTVANPTIHNIEEARALYVKTGCQAVIGFGGGSSIDCAKVVGARIAKPRQTVQKMRGLLKVHRRLPLLFAVPTTAGTGSETTLAAVITDSDNHHKYPINDFVLIPRYAVLNAKVTLGLPPHLTSTTGMDALTHAVEAYIGGTTTKKTRRYAEKAVTWIYQNIETAWRDGSSVLARKRMLYAAFLAGESFSISYVGYVHAVAHSLGGLYGVPHGLANAVILPYFLDYYGETIDGKLAALARKSGMADEGLADHEAAEMFRRWVRDVNRRMDIPEHIPEIREEDIPRLAAHADREANPLYPVPVLMDKEELAAMYRKVKGE